MRNFYRLCNGIKRRRFIVIILIGFIFGCTKNTISQPIQLTTLTNPTFTPTVEITPTQGIKVTHSPNLTLLSVDTYSQVLEMLGNVNLDRALNDIRQITGETPICIDNDCFNIKNRETGSEGLGWAENYVYQEFVILGYKVEIQDWSHSGYTDHNILAEKMGILYPEEKNYFVAHLDGVKTGLQERFPAADDNASGVVDIVEMARVISDYSFNRSIVLLISTGEEQGTLGVQSYIDQLTPVELHSIKNVVNIDMIGYDANLDNVMELWHGDHPPSIDLVNLISDTIKVYSLNLAPRFVVGCG